MLFWGGFLWAILCFSTTATWAQCVPYNAATCDTDGDGVFDINDIDDDNDGILDKVENQCPTLATWTDWSSVTANSSATGTLALTSGNVTVTYSSAQVYSIQTPGYFNLGDAYGGSMPTSSTEGLQALHGAGTTHTYTFSQPVKDPILVFWSMNSNTFTFSNPFTVIGQQNGVTRTATTLVGSASECNATIQFHGTFTSISYTSKILENWTGVTVGIQQCQNTLDTDNDTVINSLDLDSDNDGCSDAFESGATTDKTANYQFTGVVGLNGLLNTLETSADYGVIKYASTHNYALSNAQNLCIDTDNDGISDVIDIDDDNDGIPDATENKCATFAKWTDWTAITANSSATGTLALTTGGSTTVTYTSAQVYSIQGISGSYFNLGDAYGGTMPTSGIEGLQALHGSGLTHTYTFSQPVTNPILVFWSMNGNTFTLDKDFVVLGKTTGITVNGRSITGTAAAECNASIQFIGTFTSISYTSSLLENWTGVTVGTNYCPDLNSDSDVMVNRLDLDSDNDGCSDAFEGGATSDRLTPNFKFAGTVGTNGLIDSLETTADNGSIKFTSKYATFGADSANSRCELRAPGGVFTDLEFWYRPDEGVTLDAGKVTSWVDQTNGIEVTPAAPANGPTFYNSGVNAINFNPTLNFNNTTRQDGLRAATGLSAIPTGVSTFSVLMPSDASVRWFLQWGVSGSGYYANYGACSANNLGVYTNSHGGCVNAPTTMGPLTTPSFLSSRWNSTAGTNQWQLRKNGQLHSGTTSSTVLNVPTNTALEIGDVNNRTAGNEYVGNISEVIGYTSRLGDVDRQKVESYISIKYGITYMNDANTNGRNYLNSSGTTIWDTTTNANYNNNIFAIGRDDVSALNQKQSKSVNTGVQPIFSLGSTFANNATNPSVFTANNSFLFAGSNTGAARFFTPITAPVGINVNNRFSRAWKVQETGTVGTVQFAIPSNISGGNTIYLVRSTDATFDAADTWTPLSTTVTVNGVAYAAGNIDFNNGDFFTVATYVGAPGCVAANLNYWLKADAIGDDDATALAEWENQALLGLDSVGQVTATSRPTFYNTTEANLVNFNPSVSFDGGDELRQSARLFSNTSAFTTIALAVDRRTNPAELRSPLGLGDGNFPGLDFQTDGISPYGFNPWSSVDGEWLNTAPNYRLNSLGLGATNQSGNIVGLTSNNVFLGSDNIISYVNGSKDNTTISANQNAAFGNGIYVGSSGGEQWLGLIPEVIVYDKQLSDAEMQRVYSYLAIKYGSTLRQPYVNSTGVTIYDTTGYANNVAGIGREICQSLNQKQSRSMLAGFQPIIGLTSIEVTNAENAAALADNSFMIWGSNNGEASFSTTITAPSGMTANNRFARIWKVQETGTVGTVKFAIPKSGTGNTVYLVRSTDATFDATDTWIALVDYTAGSTAYLATDIDFANGDYFTVATYVAAPGCVAGGLQVWLKADAGTSSTTYGTALTEWQDQTINGRTHTQTNTSYQPKYYPNTFNFNPSVNFDGLDAMVTDAFASGNEAVHVFAMGRADDNTWGSIYGFARDLTHVQWYNGGLATKPSVYLTGNRYPATALGINYGIASYLLPKDGTQQTINWNGVSGTITNMTTYAYNSNKMGVGSDVDNTGTALSENFDGDIAEVIIYKTGAAATNGGAMTATNIQKIESYLSLKYGVTLAKPYLSGTGTTIYDTTGYANNIAGIGYEICQSLNQKQSKSITAGFQPIIGLTRIDSVNAANSSIFAADASFMIWGSDNGTASFGTAITPPTGMIANNRMTRIWKVQEMGTVGMVKFAIPQAGTGGTVYLVRSTNTTFDANDTWTPLSNYDIGGTTYLAGDIDFNNDDYFTVATYVTAPGCVTANLKTWYKADFGVTGTTEVSRWTDLANGYDVTQGTATARPSLVSSGMNFNPSLRFDGANDRLEYKAGRFMSTTSSGTFYGSANNKFDGGYENLGDLGIDNPHMGILGNQQIMWMNSSSPVQLTQTGTLSADQTYTWGYFWNGGGPNVGSGLRINGTELYDATTEATSVGSGGVVDGMFTIGSYEGVENWNGDISEVILYDRNLTTQEKQRVESYLSIRYGNTLKNNYLSGSGKVIYDYANFTNNIFGIGREDCQSLNQKQSKSVNAASKMTIGLQDSISTNNATHPSVFDQDSSFIIIGDNGLTGVITPSVSGACPPPPSADKASAQKFKVVETGAVQSIKVLFNPSGLGYSNQYPVYMQVASDSNFTNLVVNVPMQWSGSNVYTNYDFPANTTSYVRFMGNTTSLANICTASKAQTFYFNGWNYGTKTKDIAANYATSATAGDMVMKTTVTDGTPNVLLYRPTHDWWPVYDGYGLFYPRYGSSATENSTITTKIEFLSQATTGAANASTTKLAAQTANFMIWDLDGYIGSRDIVKVYGKLSGQNVDAKLTRNQHTALGLNHGGDPQSVIGGVAPWDLSYWGRLYVTFESPVEEIYIEYKQDATYAFNTYQDFRIGPITATCKAPTPKVITPDNVYIYKEVASPVKSGDVATYKFTIQNLNCGDKTINFNDILPNGSGLTWADSTVSTSLAIGSTNTYGNTRTLTLNNVTVPAGTSYIYVDAKTSTAGTYNNQATYTVGANNYVSDDPSVTGANSPTPLTIIANDPEANLTITKAVDKATAGQNEVLTYTYTITNPNGSAINTTLQDQLPADASGNTPTFVASSLTGVGSALVSTYAGAASLTIRNLSIPANGSLTVTIQANTGTYTVGDTIKNIISIVPDVAAGYRLTTKYSGSANTKIGASCAAGTTAPNLATTTLTNVCPATSANLASIAVGNKPNGTVMTWHTGTPATSSNKVADSTSVTAGTYYAVFYDAAFNCYSGATSGSATTAVTVTLDVCPANITVSNVCPATTVDLTTRFSGTVPSGKVVTWHTGLPTTTANKVANPAAVVAGTYYAAFYDSVNDCYSPGTPNGIVVTITTCVTCVAGSAAPSVPATKSNACPLTTVDLSSMTAANQPANTTLSWHTGTPANSTNILTGTTSVGAGTYYAAFYDAAANCFSTATTAVTVTITTCVTCEAGYSKPTLSATTKSNTCPTTTANLGTITASYLPVGTTLSWHSATPATLANKVADSSAVAAGTYHAAFYDKVNGCFSGNGDSTTAVVVTINSCATPDLITTIGQPTPALVAGQTSNLPVKVTNIGGVSATGPITTTITLPTGVSAPATFTTNGSTCSTSGLTVTCTNAGPIAANDSIVMNIPVTPNASIVGTTPTFNATTAPVTGETNTGNNAATPTTVTTPVAGVPDLITTIGQPSPALVVGQASDVPITIKNVGTGSAPGVITTTITLPTGTSAPATFTSNGSTCSTSGQTVTCTNAGPIPAGDSIKILVPVTPNASIVGTNPTFNATTAPVTGETNTGNNTATPMTTTAAVTASTVKVSAKVFLSGSYVTLAGMMHDSLRVKGLIPSAQPYGSIGYTGTETVALSVLTVTGANAIVDWVLVELRSDATTVVTKRAGLVQRDGDIVDTDGVTPLTFTAASGSYYVVVKHRNHLGVMSGSAIALTPTTTTVDFTSILTTNYQISGAFGSVYAQRTLGSVRGLWGGNTGGGVNIKATGSGSDAEAVYFKVLLDAGNTGFSPSYIIYNIYAREDATMDGKIIYQGTNSEVDGILFNVLLHLNNAGVLPTFVIYEQIP